VVEWQGGIVETLVGVAWYEANEWPQLRAIAPDADKLEATHTEWLAFAERTIGDLRAAGYNPYRVRVKIAALQAWCDALGRLPDANARSEYTSVELQRLHDAGLLDRDD
jgi:hypothetical protein